MSDARAGSEPPALASARARRLCLLGSAVATLLAFPHPLGGRVIDGGLVFGWLAPALLVMGVAGATPWRAAWAAFLATLAAHSAVLHWIYVVTVHYGHAPPVIGVLAPIGLSVYTASFHLGFGAAYAWLRARGAASPWVVAVLWTLADHARTWVLTGFPWASLGYAQHQNPGLLPWAPFTGVHGLTFVTALVGAALADAGLALAARRPVPRRAVWTAGAAVAIHGIGLALPVYGPPESAPRLRVAALQGNIDQGAKWSPEWADRILTTYEDLARRAAAGGAEIILWPETSLPGSPDADLELRSRLEALVRETGVVHVVGAVGLELIDGPERYRFFDSALVFDADGRETDRYHKSHLVPFGEFVPWPFRLLFGAVARGMASRDVSRGDGPRAMAMPGAPAFAGQGAPVAETPGAHGDGALLAGVVICYELLFPDLVRRFSGDSAQLLLSITNDAWYGRTGAPYQFLAITALRSAETGLWGVRAANTGVSALIDARGRVQEQTPIFERAILVVDVPLADAAAPGWTPYVRYGNWFVWVCWAGLVWMVARARATAAGGGER